MELHGEGAQQTLLVVTDRLNDALQSALTRQLQKRFPEQTPQLKLLDRDAFAAVQQLIEAGVLHANQDTARTLYRAPAADKPKDDEQSKQLTEARNRLAQSEHKRRMVKVLTEGGFSQAAPRAGDRQKRRQSLHSGDCDLFKVRCHRLFHLRFAQDHRGTQAPR